MRAPELIAFLGPSLSRAEAEHELRGSRENSGAALSFRLEPPARQGDIWRALARRPRVLALIDGLFESAPSVWHHELLDALDAGVLVFGAASMGALRACELSSAGMIGVGQIFARYQSGFDDDAAVALLHGDAESGFLPLTVALVNAEHAIAEARSAGVLTAREARAMQHAAARLHYTERRWTAILERARLGAETRARWNEFAAKGLPDLKADDARLCLREAARAALAQRHPGARREAKPRSPRPSARVRARRAEQLVALVDSELAPPTQARLATRKDSLDPQQRGDLDPQLRDHRDAQRTLFIAAAARASGLAPRPADLAAAETSLLPAHDAAARASSLLRAGVAEDELRALLETLSLETLALEHAARILPDGPSPIEAVRHSQLLRLLSRRA